MDLRDKQFESINDTYRQVEINLNKQFIPSYVQEKATAQRKRLECNAEIMTREKYVCVDIAAFMHRNALLRRYTLSLPRSVFLYSFSVVVRAAQNH